MTINFGFSVKNYKCFKSRGVSLHRIENINLLIGRNNVGKSSFIDILDTLCALDTWGGSDFPELELFQTLTDDIIAKIDFDETIDLGEPESELVGHEHLKGAVVTYSESEDSIDFLGVSCEVSEFEEYALVERYSSRFFRDETGSARVAPQGILNKKHVRLHADRDIAPEVDKKNIVFTGNGVGATQIVHALSHHSERDRELITKIFLSALNEVFSPDTRFIEMTTKYHKARDVWEIYLSEEGAKLYPLSQSGSGLKTIILVLLNLLVRPVFEDALVSEYIFSFEELENNLHPSLQRRLFKYLESFAVSNDCHIFITTHSSVAIDTYSESNNAQINHIQKVNDEVVGFVVSDSSHGYRVLSDLGNKASDLLQANGLLWVEGPSDRIFINKFIEIFGKGEIQEGVHFQFAYFGGSLLKHFDMSVPEHEGSEALNVLRINKNAVLICDGDRRSKNDPLKARVIKAMGALEESGGYSWVTECREIENCIPAESFKSVNALEGVGDIGMYESILEFLTRHEATQATEYTNKFEKAKEYVRSFSRSNLKFRPEIESNMIEICSRIRSWNFI
ncbi:ATP-dependent nuclease [Pseudomonas germanica]|uniref:ATP-binding protein n=1 Tax=Pseudomonas germanica TaxID=2815720 RepID=A0ABX8YIL7_9PSED|nr:AAA family ATPase [Pseudomonas germanica]QYY79776.1 ATP-binding protein [Pseudomonas germanica]